MYKQFTKVEIIKLAVLTICLMTQITQAQDESAKTVSSIIQMPKELHLEDQIYADINQDGLKDFVLSVSNRKKPFDRSLRIYYQQKNAPCFKIEPDKIISLTPDVIAYACADTDQYPGAEILMFTANACFGYRLGEENKDKIYKIADCQFLWQIPDPFNVFSWQDAILDFNSDGRLDFFIPEAEDYKIFFQKGSEFISTVLPTTPKEKVTNSRLNRNMSRTGMFEGSEINNPFGSEEKNKPLVNVNHSIDVPVFTDFDGNRRSDIVTQTSNHLYIWKQGETEPFFTNQYLNLDIPNGSTEDEESILADNQYVVDLNQDKYFDFILFERDKTSKKVFTQILIYLNRKNSKNEPELFNEQGIPQQLIKIAGLPGNAQFLDINRDGYSDLSFITFNPDLLDQVETLASKSLKLQFLAFINDKKGHFSRNPDISLEFNLSLEEQDISGTDPIRFLTDFNNDGLLDVLVRDKKNHIGLRLLRKTKNTLGISDKNAWDMTIPDDARIVYDKTNSDTKSVLIITSPDQVIHVRYK
jgi:hypothetical protein